MVTTLPFVAAMAALLVQPSNTHFINVIELIESYDHDVEGVQMQSNGYTIQPFSGTGSVEPRPSSDHATLFYVIRGKGTFTVGEETAPYSPGELIVVPADMSLSFATSGRKPTEGFFVLPPSPAARSTRGADDADAAETGLRLSALRIDGSELLGSGWTGPTGLVIDDFDDLSLVPSQHRPLARTLKGQAPPGIVAAADFTYRNANQVLEVVTVRVFLFDTSESCEAWWLTKYRQEGWRNHYREVEDLGYRAVDSLETPKRAVAFDKVWITSHQLQPGDDYLTVLDAYVEAISGSNR